MKTLGIVALPFLTLLAGPIIVLAAHPPVPGRAVLVVAMPWNNPEDIVARSGGDQIGAEMSPMAVLAKPGDPRFDERARAAGAIGVFDGQFLAKWCKG